jgi:hypothetical protein
MLFEWTSNDLQNKILLPNQKAEGKEEDLNCDGKVEWTMMLKLWEKEAGKT